MSEAAIAYALREGLEGIRQAINRLSSAVELLAHAHLLQAGFSKEAAKQVSLMEEQSK